MLKLSPDIWKAGLRTAAAAGVALAVSELLSLPQGYWAVITSIVVMQANLGASLAAAGDRLAGTLAGAALGFIIAYLTPATGLGTLSGLMLATGLLAMLAARNPSFRIAPVTAAILLISDPSHVDASISALHRVTEIALGCFIGIAVSLLVAPSRAESRLRNEVSRTLALLANLISAEMAGPNDKAGDAAITAISDDIYSAYDTINKLTKETEQEHASRLARSAFDAKRLRHCLRHLRTNVFFLRRITRLTWPAALGDALVGPSAAVAQVTRDYLLALGPVVAAGNPAPPLDELNRVFAQFATEAAAAARQVEVGHEPEGSGADQPSPAANGDAVAFASSFSFALEQVRFSIEELVECVNDMSTSADQS
ncbi:FUSC family protein [Mesorhizobium sp. ANAO-SY3R2]|uniref:FUSC family protein n=1 Tax=Mesorhizobium sp. ANAO-SY3R2 TaxID=3166644 RepID=UPI003670728D